jgi:hypothetical protein
MIARRVPVARRKGGGVSCRTVDREKPALRFRSIRRIIVLDRQLQNLNSLRPEPALLEHLAPSSTTFPGAPVEACMSRKDRRVVDL